MERLTAPQWSNRHYHIYANVYPKRKDMEPDFRKIVDRLGTYEDTGLTPEEVLRLKESQLDPLEMAKVAIALKEIAALKKALKLSIDTHSVDQRQVERLMQYYIQQAREEEEKRKGSP